jgi:hypothetical protein
MAVEEPFFGTRQKPVHYALILMGRAAHQPVLAAIEALDRELAPRLDAVLFAKLGG